MSDFIRDKIKWEQARYNRRTYERLMKLLKCEAENTKIRDSRYCRDFLRDLKDAVQNGFPPDFTPTPKRNTLLSYAAHNCNFQPSIIRALINVGADVNLPNPNGESVLLQYAQGYARIILGYYNRHNYIGIDVNEVGAVFSVILQKTKDVDHESSFGMTAIHQLCRNFIVSRTQSVQDIHAQELLMSCIYELLDAGASFERCLTKLRKKKTEAEAVKELTRMVYEYQSYKDFTEDITDQDINTFVR